MKIGIDYENKYDEYEVPENIGQKVVDLLEKWVEAQKITLKDTNPGNIVSIAGNPYTVLDKDFQGGVFLLSKNILFEEAFDEGNCNNWATSSLREHLNGDFLKELEEQIRAENILEFERDLTSDDGLKDYGACRDKVSLITCDEYRRYRNVSKEDIGQKDDWWWTATAYSTPYSSYSCIVRITGTGGSLIGNNAYIGSGGVAPCLCLLSSLEVERVEGDEE